MVRTGLIGCGRIAPMHAEALAALPRSLFTAVCDPFPERAREFAARYGVERVFTDPVAMLTSGEVEAVSVCTPHPTHADLVVAAAEAGVHVLCEKPIAVRLAEADRMIAACRRAGTRFGVVFQRRFWPASQRIRAAIDGGQLGHLTLAECASRLWRSQEYFASDPWRGKWATEGGGVLMNQAVHFIDLLQWFMGPAVEIVGRMATLRHGAYIDVEDTVVATVAFESGALASILAATSFEPDFGFRVAVHGSTGAAVSVWELPEGKQGINDVWTVRGEEKRRPIWEDEDRDKSGFPLFHRLQIEEFLDAVAADRDPAVTGEEARKSLEIILAIYHSSRTGQSVRLPLATDPETV
ncbi:MAG TPA: Gfo/Idh/MocA family oxidoreductase [Methylomirabilota bacterium]|nr:Gfo/Idh/MocA family oxidoreductase [Methylomirabilota bacterium]